ncbi:MAG: helix-turn-helix domain-containing protein [Myxococcales bacterium]|nr:helix-turn-helix domain-containing protein [Myxococcales bacterium]
MSAPINLYEELELDPGATEEDIRRAFKRLSRRFDPGGLVMYGLYRTPEALRLLARLKEAYNTLMDPEQRRRYDRSLFPKGHPSLRRADERVASRPPPAPRELPRDPLEAIGWPEDARLGGPTLTKVRSMAGIPLEEIAERTKISMFTLRCLESEDYGDLPAKVYLRGFLKQIARMLRLDPERLVRDYLHEYDAWVAEKARRKPW